MEKNEEEGEYFVSEPLVFVPRDEWGAQPPKAQEPMKHPVHKVVFTFDTDLPVCKNKTDCITAMQVLQGRHMRLNGCNDIKYNYLVGGDGLVYEGRGYNVQPDPSLEYPEHHGDRLDIAFLGDYTGYDAIPPKLKLIGYDIAQKGIDDGHVAEFYEYYEVEPAPRPPELESTEDFMKRITVNSVEGINFDEIMKNRNSC